VASSSLASLGRGLACGAVVLIASCGTEPGDIFSIGATVFGVVTRDGAPIPGVVVRTSLLREQCQQTLEPFGSIRRPVATDDMGRSAETVSGCGD